jgi:hypothetical protein
LDFIRGSKLDWAYLTLPNQGFWRQKRASHHEWETHESNEYSGYAMPVKLRTSPTKACLQRLPRALKLLDLETFDVYAQKRTIVESSDDESDQESSDLGEAEVESSSESDAGDESAASWPHLTVLS